MPIPTANCVCVSPRRLRSARSSGPVIRSYREQLAPANRLHRHDAFCDNGIEGLGDDTGYFIYEYDPRRQEAGIEILGKAASYDAAVRIMDIFVAVQNTTLLPRGPLDQLIE